MYLTQGQIMYHRYRGRCVFVDPTGEYEHGMAWVVFLDPPMENEVRPHPYMCVFVDCLSTVPHEPQPQPSTPTPIVITGQGSYTITITEGDI